MALPLSQIRAALEDGLLSFPITDLDERGQFNAESYATRLEWFVTHNVSSIFVAGGTGEFFSLSENEYKQIVEVTSATVKEKVPMISSVGRSIPEAIAFAKIAEKAGMNALLLMPPYLTECPQDGTYQYAKPSWTIQAYLSFTTTVPTVYYRAILSKNWQTIATISLG